MLDESCSAPLSSLPPYSFWWWLTAAVSVRQR
jgi:hypothetical protein